MSRQFWYSIYGVCIVSSSSPDTSHLPLRPLLSSYSGATAAGGGCGTCGDHCDYNKRRPSFEEEARMFFATLEENGFKIEAWVSAIRLVNAESLIMIVTIYCRPKRRTCARAIFANPFIISSILSLSFRGRKQPTHPIAVVKRAATIRRTDQGPVHWHKRCITVCVHCITHS